MKTTPPHPIYICITILDLYTLYDIYIYIIYYIIYYIVLYIILYTTLYYILS